MYNTTSTKYDPEYSSVLEESMKYSFQYDTEYPDDDIDPDDDDIEAMMYDLYVVDGF